MSAMPPDLTAHELIQTFPLEVLLAASNGELDLNALARHEIACQGRDLAGKLVGFSKAEKLEKQDEDRAAEQARLASVLTPENLLTRLDCAIAAYTCSHALPIAAAATYGRGMAMGAKAEIKLLAEAAGLQSLVREIEHRWDMHTGDHPA